MPEFLVWLSNTTVTVMGYIAWFFGTIDSVPRWLWVGGWLAWAINTKQGRAGRQRVYSEVKRFRARLEKR